MQKIITGLIFIIVLSTNCFPQSVGLVLSGGGAKGIAHIGVIKALEDNNIPIDYIAGTSIGAIVGGLYAIGFSTEEMKQLLDSDDFKKWSYGHIDINEQYYYKRKDETASWINIPVITENGEVKPQLPSNIISPAQMDLRFVEFFEPANAAAKYNFNNLMIPFFCVASDVYNRKAVILDSGSLSSSVRASMTFPGYFKPITINDVLLFDGGMENNFPSDILEEKFNPDIIIGSNVAKNPGKPDAENIYKQLKNVFMKKTDYSIPNNGFLIEPEVERFALMDFNSYDSLFFEGYKATSAKIDSIKNLIKRRVYEKEITYKRKTFKKRYKELKFQNIFISGVSKETASYITKCIKRNRTEFSFKEFEKEYFKLLSDDLIKSIYPRVSYNSKLNNYDLHLDVKTQNKFSVELGGNLSSNVRNLGFIGVDYIFQKKKIYQLKGNAVIGKFYSSIHGKFRIDFPPALNSKDKTLSPYFFDISGTNNNLNYFTTTSEWFIDNNHPLKIEQSESHIQSNVGRPIFNRGLIYSGISLGRLKDNYFHTYLIQKEDDPDITKFNYSSIHTTYEYSTLNYKQYANSGSFISAQARYITGREVYTPGTTAKAEADKTSAKHNWVKIKLNYRHYFDLSKWFTLGGYLETVYSNKKSFSNSMSTLLSAYSFQPFPQSKAVFLGDFRANSFVGAGVLPIFKITRLIDIRTELYVFEPYQSINYSDFNTSYSKIIPQPKALGSVGAILHSPFGPLALTSSFYFNKKIETYIQINFGYLLFNKRGID